MKQGNADTRPPLPWFARHVVLLWKMRMAMAQNRVRGAGRWLQSLAAVMAYLPGIALGTLAYWFMTHPAVTGEMAVSQFYLNLLCFVTAMLWVLWPILSAGVEDGSEKDRYQALPISETRLLAAAVISGLFRPVGCFMFGPLIGASAGYAVSHAPGSLLWTVILLLAFIAMCATWSQLGIYWLRDLLRTRNNGESLTLALLLLVLTGLVLPPVDVGWLYEQGGGLGAQGALQLEQFANVALAFSKVPPGYLGEALLALAEGRPSRTLLELSGMLILAMLGLVGARNRLIGSHQREAATEAIQEHRWNIFAGNGSVNNLLVRREAFELWRNPRVRLLLTVPLVLIIVLHLVSANELIFHFFGSISQLWLMGGVGLYGAALLLLTFTHNTFAYDGRGLLLLTGAPVTPLQIMASKARVHGMLSLVFGILVSLFYWRFVVPELSVVWWLLCAASILVLVPLVVSIGLFVSVIFPVKFDASLNRRERQPFLVSLLGFGGCLIGATPFILTSQWVALGGNVFLSLLLLSGCALLAWLLHYWSLPVIAAEFSRRQALILSAITRV